MIEWLARLIPLFPLVACLTTLVLGPKVLREKSHWPAIVGCGLSSLCSLILLVFVASPQLLPQDERTIPLYTWIQIPDPINTTGPALLDITLALRVDSLSATMLAMLTFVATLVVIYASGYMHGEGGYWRFFTEVSLFVFSMIMLVLAANFLQLFIFWEAVGLCSYLLIGFWYEKPEAAAAGKKAFLVNRIGDFGFVTGIFLIWDSFKTVNFAEVLDVQKIQEVAAGNSAMIPLICLCLFAGAMGKSAQFPLHVWLPDAMEGPTPVSALIHAATMVTAGVYMVARCTPLFMAAPSAQILVAFVGGFTALLAALIALTQTDLKRVLAYSTVSQLGYMFLGLGTGLLTGVGGAMLHLVTHAFFKALLFLGAGSVMHAMGGVIDMREFGGLRKKLPQTYITFLAGSLALAGCPLLSGFWSKDTILSAVHEASHESHSATAVVPAGHATGVDEHAATDAEIDDRAKAPARFLALPYPSVYKLLFWMGSFTAFLTAFYTFRAFFMTFHGPEKIPHAAGHHAHESPAVMCLPLMILAVGAVFLGGILGHMTGLFDTFLDKTIPGIHSAAAHHGYDWFVIGVSTAVFLAGLGLAYVMYAVPSALPEKLAAAFGPLTNLSRNKFYLDEVFQGLFVWPLRGLAELSRLADWLAIDTWLVGGVSRIPALVGQLPRPIQNGLVQFYALAMTLAMAVLLWALIWKQG
ncbi:MAG: NADH-quinone oxidoreductase subunit L [Planctomycetaceae bacterium]|nr:NADH-quinone oxidoreductase subunit L [Planctomycetaceae bacterium]